MTRHYCMVQFLGVLVILLAGAGLAGVAHEEVAYSPPYFRGLVCVVAVAAVGFLLIVKPIEWERDG